MNKIFNTNNEFLIPVSLMLPFFLGFQGGGFQLTLLSVGKEFQLNNASMGSLVSIQYLAFIAGPLLISMIIDKVGKKKVALFSVITFILGCVVLVLTPTILLFSVGIFTVGFGLSICQSAMSAALSDAYPGKAGKYINLTQSSYSLGAVLSPLMVQLVMSQLGVTWKFVFGFSGSGLLLLLIPLSLSYFKKPSLSKDDSTKITEHTSLKETFLPLFHSKRLFYIFASVIFYVSYESGSTFFFNSFFTLELNAPKLSPLAISLFWSAMVFSRLLTGLFHTQKRKILMCGFFGSCLILLLLSLTTSPMFSLILAFLLGIFSGPVWPTLLALATEETPESSGAVASMILCVSGIGGAFAPILMGFLADLFTIRAAFVSLIFLASFGLLSMIIHSKK